MLLLKIFYDNNIIKELHISKTNRIERVTTKLKSRYEFSNVNIRNDLRFSFYTGADNLRRRKV